MIFIIARNHIKINQNRIRQEMYGEGSTENNRSKLLYSFSWLVLKILISLIVKGDGVYLLKASEEDNSL